MSDSDGEGLRIIESGGEEGSQIDLEGVSEHQCEEEVSRMLVNDQETDSELGREQATAETSATSATTTSTGASSTITATTMTNWMAVADCDGEPASNDWRVIGED